MSTKVDRTWVLDLEAYYNTKDKYTLKKMSTVEYVKDERYKDHGIAVCDPSGSLSFEKPEVIPDILDLITPEDTVVAHNWAYDGLSLSTHQGFKHWKVIDTLLLANAVLGPARDRGRSNSLGDLATELGLEPKGRLEFMDGVLNPSEEEWRLLADYAIHDVRLTKQILEALLPRLSRPGFELWTMRHSLNIFIHRPISVSTPHLTDAIQDCRDWKQESLDRVMQPEFMQDSGFEKRPPLIDKEIQLSSQKQFAEILQPLCDANGIAFPMKTVPPTPTQKKKGETANRSIPALAKKDETFQALKVCGVKDIEDIVNARLVQRSATTVLARLNKLYGTSEAHMSLTYHGACTGRWTGGGNGWNPQNIPSVGRAVTEEERRMAKGIRSCLRAEPGHVFVTVDASQIEARVLAWLAGQVDVVEAFGNGVDLYSDFIGDVLGEHVYKPADKSDPNYDTMTALRNVGKECILGLGYGMGWFKLFTRIREHPQAADIRAVLGSKLNAGFIKTLVNGYRAKYAQIPELWDDLDSSFHVARKGSVSAAGCEGQIRFESENMFESMHMILPSSRRVRYAGFKKYKTDRGYLEWMYGSGRKIYGGLVTENAVQATSRDHLAECIYAMEHMDYPVVLTVHDSIIAHVPETRAEQCLADCVGMLSESPTWGPGLQLDAEGGIAEDFN